MSLAIIVLCVVAVKIIDVLIHHELGGLLTLTLSLRVVATDLTIVSTNELIATTILVRRSSSHSVSHVVMVRIPTHSTHISTSSLVAASHIGTSSSSSIRELLLLLLLLLVILLLRLLRLMTESLLLLATGRRLVETLIVVFSEVVRVVIL